MSMSISFSINVIPSLILRRLSCIPYLLSVISLCYVTSLFEGNTRLVAGLIVAVISLVNGYLLKRFWRKQTCYQLRMNESGDMVLSSLNSQFLPLETWEVKLHSATIFPATLILICLRDSDMRDRRLLVFYDSLTSDALRRLQISLRWLQSKSLGDQRRKISLIDGNF